MEVGQKSKSYQERGVSPIPEIQPNLNETVSPIEIFSLVTSLVELLELIVEQSNLFARHNGRNLTVTKDPIGTRHRFNVYKRSIRRWRCLIDVL